MRYPAGWAAIMVVKFEKTAAKKNDEKACRRETDIR
jgi:hypothetical protein